MSGPEAIRMVEDTHQKGEDYHVILLDRKMPGMDGIEAAARIRWIVGTEVTILALASYD